MNHLKTIAVSLFCLALMACGGTGDETTAQINEETLQVAFVENLNCGEALANPGTMGGDGGGPNRPAKYDISESFFSTDSQTCSGYIWEVSGECTNCNDLLVEVGDSSAVIAVGESGEFTFTMQAISDEAPLLLTPMRDGVLGIQSYADLLLDL